MKQIIVILAFVLGGSSLTAQKIFWSDFTPEDKQKALEIGLQFYSYLSDMEKDSLSFLISKNKIYLGENAWIKSKDFVDEVLQNNRDDKFQDLKIQGFTFEDFLNNYLENSIIEQVYRCFDNHSVVASVTYLLNGKKKENLILLKRNTIGIWQITGHLGLLNTGKYESNQSDIQSMMKYEKVSSQEVRMPVPRDFKGPEIINNQTFFFFEGKSGRDAVFQVMTDQLTSKLHVFTYKFVEHSNQQFKMSNLIVRYVPAGVLIEYEVIDPYGSKNKGITIGIEKNGQVIIIQYYSFINVYSKISELIKYTFNHIRK